MDSFYKILSNFLLQLSKLLFLKYVLDFILIPKCQVYTEIVMKILDVKFKKLFSSQPTLQ